MVKRVQVQKAIFKVWKLNKHAKPALNNINQLQKNNFMLHLFHLKSQPQLVSVNDNFIPIKSRKVFFPTAE